MDLARAIRDPGLVATKRAEVLVDPLSIEWVSWLSAYPWHYFLTITFRDMVPMRRQESVLHAVGETLCASHALDRLFLVSEAHQSQTLHLHGLYRCGTEREDIRKYQMGDVWRVLFTIFGRSKVEAPRSKDHVAAYCTKYCLKSGGYYELFGPSTGLG